MGLSDYPIVLQSCSLPRASLAPLTRLRAAPPGEGRPPVRTATPAQGQMRRPPPRGPRAARGWCGWRRAARTAPPRALVRWRPARPRLPRSRGARRAATTARWLPSAARLGAPVGWRRSSATRRRAARSAASARRSCRRARRASLPSDRSPPPPRTAAPCARGTARAQRGAAPRAARAAPQEACAGLRARVPPCTQHSCRRDGAAPCRARQPRTPPFESWRRARRPAAAARLAPAPP
mmetsp:Transcript_38370/g.124245  ORF Transcript_38370/g.124245 Transcript_38370/m.124245 type:complete len:237 (+) Transcript_38370:38-748(+)